MSFDACAILFSLWGFFVQFVLFNTKPSLRLLTKPPLCALMNVTDNHRTERSIIMHEKYCFKTLDGDMEYLLNKYHRQDENYNPFARFDYHGYEYDSSTGLTDEEIVAGIDKIVAEFGNNTDYNNQILKARLVEYVLDNTRIDVNEHDYFVGIYTWGRVIKKVIDKWSARCYAKYVGEKKQVLDDFWASGTAWTWLDFDHTVPDWDSLLTLGFKGILERARRSYEIKKANGTLTEKQEIFFTALEIEYTAILRIMDRFVKYAGTKTHAKAKVTKVSLEHLRDGGARDTYDALHMMYLYFMISESIDYYQVRSLGYGLDASLYPFYKKDIESGRYTKDEIAEFIAYFLQQFSCIENYWGQPFYLAGTNADGTTKVNELTHMILDVYYQMGIYNPKIQFKVCDRTPKDIVMKALDMVRNGVNSIVFVNEDIITKALMSRGVPYEEACDSVISGCYEYKSKRGGIDISSIYIDGLKAVCFALSDGLDKTTGKQLGLKTGDPRSFDAFDKFYNAVRAQLGHINETCFTYICEAERHVGEVNPSVLFSGTLAECAENLTDAIDGGVTNRTGTLFCGFASLVDATMAVYELVYERKVCTMDELLKALDANWEGYEKLRAKALNCKHKFGNNDRIADSYADAFHKFYAADLAGRRNAHGGTYGYELHSARAFIEQGKRVEATPDGRRAGEEMSKNVSPVPGADRNGITAAINSVTSMDMSLNDVGGCLDAMLHPSAVSGDDGLEAFYGIIMTYVKQGGASIHVNVFNVDTLREAQKHPEKYRTLQVRVCGWNVLWNNLPKSEQDVYIMRAEAMV